MCRTRIRPPGRNYPAALAIVAMLRASASKVDRLIMPVVMRDLPFGARHEDGIRAGCSCVSPVLSRVATAPSSDSAKVLLRHRRSLAAWARREGADRHPGEEQGEPSERRHDEGHDGNPPCRIDEVEKPEIAVSADERRQYDSQDDARHRRGDRQALHGLFGSCTPPHGSSTVPSSRR